MKKPRKMPRLTTAPAAPVKTHGAAHRAAPKGTHKNKEKLTRSNSAPSGTHLSKTTLKRSESTPKKSHDRSANLGKYLHPAKMPTGRKIGVVKSVASEIKSKSGRMY